MFIGREYELKKLNDLYNTDKFQMVIIYGRRRVGKTTLMTKFCKDKDSIFYVGDEYNDELSLKKFTSVVTKHWNENYLEKFKDWENGFNYIADKSNGKRLVLIIDEFPYIAGVNKSIMSTLQNLIDHKLKDTKLFIILCGSSISFMIEDVLGYKSPLFGRRTAEFEIKPLGFFEMIEMYPNYSEENLIKLYGTIGGTPHYMNLMSNSNDLKTNIMNNFLDKSSYLYREPINLLKQELREPYIYNSIIQAIGSGATKINEISAKIGEKTDKTSNYIKVLTELRIVEKIKPITEKSTSRKTLYKLSENMFKFYYRFVAPNEHLVEMDMVEHLYENEIEPKMNEYLGLIYEDICAEYLMKKNKELSLPFVAKAFGKWWGNNPIKKQEEEIDIVAIGDDKVIVAECKFRNEKIKMHVLDRLIEKSNLLNYSNKYYYLFSKLGFEKKLIEYAEKNENVFLIQKLL